MIAARGEAATGYALRAFSRATKQSDNTSERSKALQLSTAGG